MKYSLTLRTVYSITSVVACPDNAVPTSVTFPAQEGLTIAHSHWRLVPPTRIPGLAQHSARLYEFTFTGAIFNVVSTPNPRS